MNDFVNLMLKTADIPRNSGVLKNQMVLDKSKETKSTEPQSRTGNVDPKSAEKLLKEIQEKLQKK